MPKDTIIQRLSWASANAVTAMAGNSNDDEHNALSDLNDLVEELLSSWESKEPDDLATKEEIDRAFSEYGSDDINVDPGALASRYDQGLWVQAWVHLPDEKEA